MEKTKVIITRVIKDRHYDCIETIIEGVPTQIGFGKNANVGQYEGKEVYLSKAAGADFIIEDIIDEVDELVEDTEMVELVEIEEVEEPSEIAHDDEIASEEPANIEAE